jgi:hypothetical protein
MMEYINLWVVFGILLIHFVGDFVLQTHWQASNKSFNNKALLSHTGIYSLCWIPFIVLLIILRNKSLDLLWFIPITFLAHTITDYFTSRETSKLWKKGDTHNFFVVIGFDQVLHAVQLLLTYHLLTLN